MSLLRRWPLHPPHHFCSSLRRDAQTRRGAASPHAPYFEAVGPKNVNPGKLPFRLDIVEVLERKARLGRGEGVAEVGRDRYGPYHGPGKRF